MFNRRKFLKLILTVTGFFFSSKVSFAAPDLLQPNMNTDLSSSADSIVLRVHNFALSSTEKDQVRQKKIFEMVEQGLNKITGKNSLKDAWLQILQNYKKGDSIAIKPNFNSIHLNNKNIITSPDLLSVLVNQLIEVVGVQPYNIYLYDLCKKIPDSIKSQIHPNIRYIERFDPESVLDKIKMRLRLDPAAGATAAEISMRNSIKDDLGRPVKCFIPKVLSRVQHLINVPLLTNHVFISNSGALKNHFGTVRFSNYSSYPVSLHGDFINESIADINMHPVIRGKTKLIIADGIVGVFDRGEGEGGKKWITFGNDFPKSIFLSKDPVALDSVMAEHVMQERRKRNLTTLSDSYLQIAADSGLGLNLKRQGKIGGKVKYSTFTI